MTAPTASPAESRAAQAAQVLALVEAQAAARHLISGQIVGLVHAMTMGFDAWYDTAAISAWADRVATGVEPLLRQLARSTAAFQSRILSQITGRRVQPVGTVDVTTLRQGITHAGAYGRAADVYRWQQSQFDAAAKALLATIGEPRVPDLQSPQDAALERALAVADMDTQLAVRQQSQRSMTDAAKRGLITGWRRVIHPELSKGGTCGLCVAASDRLYGPKEPMPLHAHCNCVPMPIYRHKDPGSVLNYSDLERLYKDAGGTSREKLKRTRYKVVEHGELGPLLSDHDGKVRTRRQVKKDTTPPRQEKTPEEKRAELKRVRDGLMPALDKARGLAAENPKKWGRYLAQLEARIADLDHQLG